MTQTQISQRNHDPSDSLTKKQSSSSIREDSKKLIEKAIINIVILSFSMGYTMVYFNAFKFDDLVNIFELNFQKSLEQGLLTSCIPIGACIGALCSKIFLKKLSRKQCFYLLNALNLIAIAMIQTKYLIFIVLGRGLQGFFIGSGMAIVPLYIKQFIPQLNGKYGVYSEFFFIAGTIWGFAFNLILHLTFGDSKDYWRLNFAFPLILSIYQTYKIKYRYNFQTPRYWVSKNKNDEAMKMLPLFYEEQNAKKQFQILYQATHLKKYNQSSEINNVQQNNKKNNRNQVQNIKSQFGQNEMIQYGFDNSPQKIIDNSPSNKPKQFSHPLAIICTLHLSFHRQIIGFGAVLLYSGDIVKQIVPQLFYYYSVFLHTFGLICVVFGLPLIKRYGRAFLLQSGSIAMFLFLFLIGVNFLLGDHGSKWMIIISVILLRGAFSCTLGAIYWVYISEIVKPSIIPYGSLINQVGSSLVIFLFPIISQKIGGPGWIFVFNGFLCVISIIVNHLTLVESKDKNQILIWQDFERKLRNLKKFKIF